MNPKNIKVQWLSRRLSLRVRVDVQVGARASDGGLSAADRQVIASSLYDRAVLIKLR